MKVLWRFSVYSLAFDPPTSEQTDGDGVIRSWQYIIGQREPAAMENSVRSVV